MAKFIILFILLLVIVGDTIRMANKPAQDCQTIRECYEWDNNGHQPTEEELRIYEKNFSN